MNKKPIVSNKRILFSFFLLITFSIYAISCDGKDDITEPSSLNLTITIQGVNESNPNGDGSGIIKCIATAKNAVRYAYKFEGGDLQESTDGTIDHTFLKQGTNTFSVLVFAYSTSGEFINTTKSIRIFVSEKEEPTLIFSDEFNVDGAPNAANWTYDLGAGGWGNGELQTYTNNAENVIVENGILKITAIANGAGYTSARLKSENLYQFTYGRVEVRAKLPAAQGTWPAIWMLGANFDTVGWPNCGEIDIMEQTGQDKTKTSGALHFPENSGGNAPTNSIQNSTSTSEFHNYTVEWTPSVIKLFVDDEMFFSFDNTAANLPFNLDFFMILNVAMGGTLGGTIDPGFTSDTMEIDYVRVYQ